MSFSATAFSQPGGRSAVKLDLPTPAMYNRRHEGRRENDLSGHFRYPGAKEEGSSAAFALIFRPENRAGRRFARASCSAQAGARTAHCREIDGPSAQLVGARRFAVARDAPVRAAKCG